MSEPIKSPITPATRPEYDGPSWYLLRLDESRKQQEAEAAAEAARKQAIAASLPPPIITFDPDLPLVVKAVTEGLVESSNPIISINALDDNPRDFFDFEQGVPSNFEIKILPPKVDLGGYGLQIAPFGNDDIEVRIIDPNHTEPWILRSGKNNNPGNKIYPLANFPAFEVQIGELLKRQIINFTTRNLRTLLDLTKKNQTS